MEPSTKLLSLFKFIKNRERTVSINVLYGHPDEPKFFKSLSKYKNIVKTITVNTLGLKGVNNHKLIHNESYIRICELIENNSESLTHLKFKDFGITWNIIDLYEQINLGNSLSERILRCQNLESIHLINSYIDEEFLAQLFLLQSLKTIICEQAQFATWKKNKPNNNIIKYIKENKNIINFILLYTSYQASTNILEIISSEISHPLQVIHDGHGELRHKKIQLYSSNYHEYQIHNLEINYLVKLISKGKLKEITIESAQLYRNNNTTEGPILELAQSLCSCTSFRKLKLFHNTKGRTVQPEKFEIPLIQALTSTLHTIELILENCSFSIDIPTIVNKLKVINIVQPKGYQFASFPLNLLEFQLINCTINNKLLKEIINFIIHCPTIKTIQFIKNVFPTGQLYTNNFLKALPRMSSCVDNFEFIQNQVHNLKLSDFLASISEKSFKSIKLVSTFQLKDLNLGLNKLFELDMRHEKQDLDSRIQHKFFNFTQKRAQIKEIQFLIGFQMDERYKLRKLIFEASPYQDLFHLSEFAKFDNLYSIKILKRTDISTIIYSIQNNSPLREEIKLLLKNPPKRLTTLDLKLPFDSEFLTFYLHLLNETPAKLRKLHFSCKCTEINLIPLFEYLSQTKGLVRVNIEEIFDPIRQDEEMSKMLIEDTMKTINTFLKSIFIPKLRITVPKMIPPPAVEFRARYTMINQGLKIRANDEKIRRIFGYD